jgi:hypothetical protein
MKTLRHGSRAGLLCPVYLKGALRQPPTALRRSVLTCCVVVALALAPASPASVTNAEAFDDPFTAAAHRYPHLGLGPSPSPLPRVGPPLAVQATGGIGNRLRVLLSYVAEARAMRRPLTVYWRPDAHCPGPFSSVFEPLAPHDALVLDSPPPPGTPQTYSALPGYKVSALGPLALEVGRCDKGSA